MEKINTQILKNQDLIFTSKYGINVLKHNKSFKKYLKHFDGLPLKIQNKNNIITRYIVYITLIRYLILQR